jgi:hypothetical protein
MGPADALYASGEAIDESDRVAREAMLWPLIEEPVDIERESAWDDPKGFLIGGMMRGTIQETAHQYINAAKSSSMRSSTTRLMTSAWHIQPCSSTDMLSN